MLRRALPLAFLCACHRPVLPGSIERSVAFDGAKRTYIVHPGATAKKSGLIIALHGLGGDGASIERRTRMDASAERAGMVVAYPDAVDAQWSAWPTAKIDDLGFLRVLATSLVSEYRIDPARVFAVGLSRGASMVSRLVCDSDVVAAAALVSGGVPPMIVESCKKGRAVSIVQLHGTADQVVPFDEVVPMALATWTARDGCTSPPRTTQLPDTDPSDGTRVRLDQYDCRDGSEVALYTIEDGGHQWPGGEPSTKPSAGKTSRDIDASEIIVTFFSKHAR